MSDLRVCSKCSEAHPVAFFNKDRSRPNGIYPQCKTCSRGACRRVYRKYHERHVEAKREWKRENPELRRQINRDWRAAHPDKAAANTAEYRARLKRATPPWVDRAELKRIRDACPPGYHVDHIHPLKGENFSGLNVPWNLQYLLAEVHWKKGNRLQLEAGV